MQSTEPEISVKVFVSYARADQDLRKKLENHLSSLKYSGEVTLWQDQEIPAGANWEDQIHTHLDEADIILLLISSDFIASKYCWNKEVQAALQRHQVGTVRVIPIILRPVRWQNTPLGQLQALPTRAKPITQWDDQDAALEDVVEGIQGVVDTLRSSVLASTSPAWTKEQWVDTGKGHYHAGHYTEALSAYEQAISLDPKDAGAYSNRGLALYNLKRYEEALSAYEQAIGLDPQLAGAYSNKSLALCDLKRYAEALSACEQAINLDPKLTLAYNNKGNVLYDLRRYEEALSAFEQAINLDPQFASAYNNKGNALYDLKRYEEALSAFEQAIDLDPQFAYAYNGKSTTLEHLGRYTEAKQAYEKARQLGINR